MVVKEKKKYMCAMDVDKLVHCQNHTCPIPYNYAFAIDWNFHAVMY